MRIPVAQQQLHAGSRFLLRTTQFALVCFWIMDEKEVESNVPAHYIFATTSRQCNDWTTQGARRNDWLYDELRHALYLVYYGQPFALRWMRHAWWEV